MWDGNGGSMRRRESCCWQTASANFIRSHVRMAMQALCLPGMQERFELVLLTASFLFP